ncbi:MAG: hypothetical protein P4L61_02770, partial [Candidatus Pacebacteria bacterium]|nr:hypothetical protein [Candidatus Paceibacterota bacterium]
MPKTVTYDEKIAALKITTAALKNAAKCVLCLRYYHINSADFVRHEFEVDDEIVERGQLVLYLANLNLTGFGSENPARVIVSGKCVAELLIFDSQGNKSSAQTEFMLSQQEAIKLRKLYERRKAAEPARPEPTAGSPSSEPQGDPAATATIPQPEAAKKVPAPHAPLLMMEAVENEIKRKSFEATSIKIKIRESQEVLNSLANDAADRKAEYEKTIAGLKQSFADESQKRLKELSDAFSAETKKVYDECNRRTEHALTELEQRCKQLPQESAPAPVIIADQSGEIERQLAVLRTKAAEVEALKETFRSGVGDAA